jgi:hypothetical protein
LTWFIKLTKTTAEVVGEGERERMCVGVSERPLEARKVRIFNVGWSNFYEYPF